MLRAPARGYRLLTLALLAAAAPSTATTYYVKTTGKDTNTGLTPAAAFKTISKAASVAGPGDTVYIGGGAYNENISIANSGTSANPIRFVGDTNGTFTGKGGRVAFGKAGGDALTVNGKNYIRFYNVRIRKAANNIIWKNASGGLLENCLIFSAAHDGLNITNASLTLSNCKCYANKEDGLQASGQSTVIITDSQFHGNKGRGLTAAGPGLSLTASRSRIFSNQSAGVDLQDAITTLTNCLIYSNKTEGITFDAGPGIAASATIRQCTIARNKRDGLLQSAGSSTVINSIFALNSGQGIDLDGGTMTHTNNCLWSNTGGAFHGTTQSTAEITSDPKFKSKKDYALQTASPAINAGANLGSAVIDDVLASPRPQGGGYDMGCFEGTGTPIFTDISTAAGFNRTTTSSEHDGSGMHWVDLDADGDLDCIITGSSAYIMSSNSAGASFSAASLGSIRRQGALADLDSDGDPDFWAACVGGYNTETLLLNDHGSLADSGNAGFLAPAGNEAVAAADADSDGWADIVMFSETGNYIALNQRTTTVALSGSTPAGLNGSGCAGNGDYCSSADINNDGCPDFFYHFNSGLLFLSNGEGGWSRTICGISVPTGNNRKFGSAWADIDNDGDLDLFTPSFNVEEPGMLWENDGGVFEDTAEDSGLLPGAGQRSCCFGDFDNDGDQDLFITARDEGCTLYRNTGDGFFQLIDEGTDIDGDCQDACFVDYDNDGDLDLAITRTNASTVLLRNGTNNADYLKVRLIGAGNHATNTLAIGTRIELYDSSGALLARRDCGSARGFAGAEPLWLHFGGVDPAQPYTLKVYFKSGVQTATVTPASVSTTIGARTINQMVTIQEPPASAPIRIVRWREVTVDE